MTERFVSPCPPPTAYERELLEILIEECAEVQQRATKMLRFGVQEVQPSQGLTNVARLSMEWGDLQSVARRCLAAGLLSPIHITAGCARKNSQLAKYMQHTPE